jgi:hypothetical protein
VTREISLDLSDTMALNGFPQANQSTLNGILETWFSIIDVWDLHVLCKARKRGNLTLNQLACFLSLVHRVADVWRLDVVLPVDA